MKFPFNAGSTPEDVDDDDDVDDADTIVGSVHLAETTIGPNVGTNLSTTSSEHVRPLPISEFPPPAPVATAPTLHAGHVVAQRYRILRPIGAGGMGTVYAALDLKNGSEVAIKTLNPQRHPTSSLQRFRREATAASRMRHPHLCEVKELIFEHDTPYLIMEHLTGETAAHRLRRGGAFSVVDAVVITLQLADALSAVHANGYLHRDVKPGNVLLLDGRGGPFVKLFDFGLARRVRPKAMREETITTAGCIAGTPGYLTPEQLRGARDLDERVDVWALGVMFYEMLTGSSPFNGRDFPELAQQVLLAPPPRLSEARADVPLELDGVLTKALAKNREERFGTADEFRQALAASWAQYRVSAMIRSTELFRRERPKRR